MRVEHGKEIILGVTGLSKLATVESYNDGSGWVCIGAIGGEDSFLFDFDDWHNFKILVDMIDLELKGSVK